MKVGYMSAWMRENVGSKRSANKLICNKYLRCLRDSDDYPQQGHARLSLNRSGSAVEQRYGSSVVVKEIRA